MQCQNLKRCQRAYDVPMAADDPDQVLNQLRVRPGRVVALSDVPLGNGNWLVETADGQRCVLLRYHPQTTQQDLAYEQAVLGYLAGLGWVVPAALSEPACWQGRWYCLTRYVPGEAVRAEDAAQRGRRGRDLARLHLALRGVAERIGQRPGWRAQHSAVTVQGDDQCSLPAAAIFADFPVAVLLSGQEV